MSSRDGGPAFPRPFSWDESPLTGLHCGDRVEAIYDQTGMTLRQWYAGQALSRSIEVAAQFVMEEPDFKPDTVGLLELMRRAAGYAVAAADALIAAESGHPQPPFERAQ